MHVLTNYTLKSVLLAALRTELVNVDSVAITIDGIYQYWQLELTA